MTDTSFVYYDSEPTGDEVVVLTLEEYNELIEAQTLLNALHAVGLDNWEGYSEALENLSYNEQ